MNGLNGLLTDLYQVTMAQGYFLEDRHEDVTTFQMTFRKAPFKGNFALVAGIQVVMDWLHDLRITDAEVDYLSSLLGNDETPLFRNEFLQYLKQYGLCRRQLQVVSKRDGDLAYPHEPIVRVTGPLWVVQWIETHLLQVVNFHTLIATKAARCVQAANGSPVLEFGYRRAQDPMGASLAAYIGGCVATSNVEAGRRYGIPVKGTHAHSWVMLFGDEDKEQASFDSYAKALPNNVTLLVDTYDTINGVKKAIRTFRAMREAGHTPYGIRLDSGDLAALSADARALLNEAGFHDVKIVASNDLDEHKIASINANGGAVDVWGVGTQLVTAADQPALGGVYKLAAVYTEGKWIGRSKRSNDAIKSSDPGMLKAWHGFDAEGLLRMVVLCQQDETPPTEGRPVYSRDLRSSQTTDDVKWFSCDSFLWNFEQAEPVAHARQRAQIALGRAPTTEIPVLLSAAVYTEKLKITKS